MQRFSRKVPLFLSEFNETSTFATDFSKNPHISNFMKIRPVRLLMPSLHYNGEISQKDSYDTRGFTSSLLKI